MYLKLNIYLWLEKSIVTEFLLIVLSPFLLYIYIYLNVYLYMWEFKGSSEVTQVLCFCFKLGGKFYVAATK